MKNILVMFGGNVLEKDISIITAIISIKNINKKLYNIYPIYLKNNKFLTTKKELSINDFTNFNNKNWTEINFVNKGIIVKQFIPKLININCALLCTHGGIYEGGGLQGLLEIYNIPYTSSDILVSSLCMDKAKSKVFFNRIGLNTVDYLLVNKKDYLKNTNLILNKIEKLQYPIIVKPNDQGSSFGINIAKNISELKDNIEIALNFSNNIIVERALENFIEYNCAGLNSNIGLTISDIEKPCLKDDILSFNDKYINKLEVEFPANISIDLENQIKNTTKSIFERLDIKGVARCDYMYDTLNKKLYINEINTIPGSLAFYLFKYQYSFAELLNIMIESSIENKNSNLITNYDTNVLNNFKNCSKLDISK